MAFLWWFLFGEMRALVALLGIWLLTGGPFGKGSLRRTRWIYALRVHWSGSHLGGIRALFGLRFEVEGLELAGPGPAVIMMRHASIVDNLLPDVFVARTHGIGLRFVVKRELQMIPTIDIGGRWAPTFYARRGSGDTAGEVAALRSLAHGLGAQRGDRDLPRGHEVHHRQAQPRQGGDRRAPARGGASRPAASSTCCRRGSAGPIALLEEATGADVVFCGHAGFDGYAHISDIWSGRLVGKTIHIRFWRHPAAEVPRDEEGLVAWLYERWHVLDDWVGEQRRIEHEEGVVS